MAQTSETALEELKTLQQVGEQVEQQISILSQNQLFIEQSKKETQDTVVAIEAIMQTYDSSSENGKKDLLVPIGGGVTIELQLPESIKFLTNIGAKVHVNLEHEKVLEMLQSRIGILEEQRKQVVKGLEEMSKQQSTISLRIQQLSVMLRSG